MLQIHLRFPEEPEALRYIARLATELGDSARAASADAALAKVERSIALRAPVPAPTHARSTASRQNARGSVVGGGAGAPVATGVQNDWAGGHQGLEEGLGGGGMLLPETMPVSVGQQMAGGGLVAYRQAPGGQGGTMWEEELGADLLPGLD